MKRLRLQCKKLLACVLAMVLIAGILPMPITASAGALMAADALRVDVTAQTFQISGESTADNIKLNWSLVSGATSYAIYRSAGEGGPFVFLASRKGTTYDDYGIGGKTYYYKVEALEEGVTLAESTAVAGVAITLDDGFKTYDNTMQNTLELPESLKVGDTYYRYDISYTGGHGIIKEGTSADGFNFSGWRTVFDESKHNDLANCKLESANIRINKDGKVIIWAHYEEGGSTYNTAGVISIYGTPGGSNFTTSGHFRPQNNESRDLNFFANDDGTGYLISASNNNADLKLYRLNADWTALDNTFAALTLCEGQHREAPSLIQKDGWYYLFSSRANGWLPSDGAYISAPSIAGLATAELRPVGNTSTFGAQSGGIIKIGNNYYMMANRWSGGWYYPDPVLDSQGKWSAQRMLPIALNEGFASYDYYAKVKYNPATGVAVPVQNGRILSIEKSSGMLEFGDTPPPTSGNYANSVASNGNDGIGYVKEDSALYVPAGTGPYQYTVDLGIPSKINQIDISFRHIGGSDVFNEYRLLGSKDGKSWTTLKDRSTNKIVGFNENIITIAGEYRYIQLQVSDIKRAATNGTPGTSLNADWTRGFYEFTVYGTPGAGSAYSGVPVGETWYDTDGNPIQAHGGGFLLYDGWYYWVGEDKSHDSANFKSVNLYKSQDLLNWQYVAPILTPGSQTAGYKGNDGSNLQNPRFGQIIDPVTGKATIERPKLLYNEKTKTFVLWAHWENGDGYAASQLMVATSKNIEGPYTFQKHFRPGVGFAETHEEDPTWAGEKHAGTGSDGAAVTFGKWGYGSRDFTIFKDPDNNNAYLISAQDHMSMRIYKLTDDYTDVDWQNSYPVFEDMRREAPAMMKVDGVYYLITSDQNGWFPNQAAYATTENIDDGSSWERYKVLSDLTVIGDTHSYYSQPTSIMVIPKKDGGYTYVYMGDRWYADKLSRSNYVWLPLRFAEADEYDYIGGRKRLVMDYTSGWKINAATGEVVASELVNITRGRIPEVNPAAYVDAKSGWKYDEKFITDGKNSNNTNDAWNDTNEFYSPMKVPYDIVFDFDRPRFLARMDMSVKTHKGSDAAYGYYVYGSNDKQNWTMIVDQTANERVGFRSDRLSGNYRYLKVTVVSVIDRYPHNNYGRGTEGWSNGIREIAVYSKEPAPTDIVELVDPPVYAVYDTQGANGLPKTLKARQANGDVINAPVTWETVGMNFSAYNTITVTGQMAGDFAFDAKVEVIKPGTVYFINAGTTATGSDVYDGVKRVLGSALKNELSDKPYSGSGWGYAHTGSATARFDKYATDKYATGFYGANDGSSTLSYKLLLDAGAYNIAIGLQEWWSGPRTTIARLSYQNDAGQTVTIPLNGTLGTTVSGGGSRAVIEGNFTLETAKTITLSLTKGTAGDAQVVSWVEVSALSSDKSELVRRIVEIREALQTGPVGTGIPGAKYAEEPLDAELYLLGAAPRDNLQDLNEALDYAQGVITNEAATLVQVSIALAAINNIYKNLRVVPTYDKFSGVNGDVWLDTNGVKIQAHGGQVQKLNDGKWWWIGEDKAEGYRGKGMTAYSSTDLYNWKFEGYALRTVGTQEQLNSDPYFSALYGSLSASEKAEIYTCINDTKAVFERPKIIYNEETGKYVMWFHNDGPTLASPNSDYASSAVGVATADNPQGPYTFIKRTRGHQLPDSQYNLSNWWESAGNRGYARDMNLFVDDDKKAYIIYSSEENMTLFISRLNDEYTDFDVPISPVGQAINGKDFARLFSGAQREAPALFKYDGIYYIVTSGATGWDPNMAQYWINETDDILNPNAWKNMGDPSVSHQGDPYPANKMFNSQSTNVAPYSPDDGWFIFMSDRWNSGNLGDSRYVWLPIAISTPGKLELKGYKNWDLSVFEDQIRVAGQLDSVYYKDGDLPKKLTVEHRENGSWVSEEIPVNWPSISSLPMTSAVTNLTGEITVSGKPYEIKVRAVNIPENLLYYADSGATASDMFNLIVEKGYATGLKNQGTPDKKSTGSEDWGYTGTIGQNGLGVIGADSRDAFQSGFYFNGNPGLTYRFPIDGNGQYRLSAGFREFWASGSGHNRTIIITVSYPNINGGTTEAKKTQFLLGSDQERMTDDLFDVTGLSMTGKYLDVTISNGSGEGPVMSWLSLAGTSVPNAYAPKIEKQPKDVNADEGKTATFTVEAVKPAGYGDKLTYQWQKKNSGDEWVNVEGAKKASYTTPVLDENDAREQFFRVVIYNVEWNTNVGGVLSDAARLTVKVPQPTEAAKPGFSLPGGTYYMAQTVAITVRKTQSDTTKIYYTTNGDIPTVDSNLYTGPITVSADMTIRAIGIEKDLPDSAVVEAAYIIAPTPKNIALKKTASASSQENAGRSPANANDGDTVRTLKWAASGNQWWKVDLQSSYYLDGAEIYFSESGTKLYRIEVSKDNVNWTTVYEKELTTTSTTILSASFGVPVTGRYVRVNGVSGSGWSGLWEVYVFGRAENGASASVEALAALQALYDANSEKLASGYTAVSFGILTTALENALTVLDKGSSAEQSEVDIAYDELTEAVSELKPRPSKPVITLPPQDYTAEIGETATLTVTAAGDGTLSYQWQKKSSESNWTDIAGARAASYTTAALAESDTGALLRVVVTNTLNGETSSVNSLPAMLTVNAASSAAPKPVFGLPGGTYYMAQKVSLSVGKTGVDIYYTTDGNDPDLSSARYTAPISVGGMTTIKAVGVQSGKTNSEVVTAVYAIEATPGNIALNKPTTASSNEGGATGNTPGKAVDGSASTKWTANGSGRPQWWRVDLEGLYYIDGVKIDWEQNGPHRYAIEMSIDGVNWTKVFEKSDSANEKTPIIPFGVPIAGKYLRVNETAGPGWVSIYEIDVYGRTLEGSAVSKTNLQALYDANKDTAGDKYSAASFAALQTVLASSLDVLQNGNATVSEVATAEAALRAAISGLKPKTKPPVIEDQPQGISGAVGEKVLFSVFAQTPDGGILSYQWQKLTDTEWVNISGATGSIHTVTVKAEDDRTQYRVIVTNTLNGESVNAESDTAELTAETNKKALAKAIAAAEALTESNYTAGSWSVLQPVLTEAKAVNSKIDADQNEINAASVALNGAINNLVSLIALKAEYGSLDAVTNDDSKYTESSFAALQDALATAKSVLNNSDATKAEVDAALAALLTAGDNLVNLAVELQKLYDLTRGYDEGDYTVSSWTHFSGKLAAAKTVLDDTSATAGEISVAYYNLLEASQTLEKRGYMGVLRTRLNQFEGLYKQADYSQDSWAVYMLALQTVQEFIQNDEGNYTIDDVREMLAALEAAPNSLETLAAAARNELQSLVESAKAMLNNPSYISGFDALQVSISAAQTVLTNLSATYEQLSGAITNLQDAIGGLISKNSKEGLQILITFVQGLNENNYMPGRWMVLQGALTQAVRIYEDDDSDEEAYGKAYDTLRDAYTALNLTADKNALNAEIIRAAEILSSGAYKPNSLVGLDTALAAAQEAAADEDATQEEVDAVLAALLAKISEASYKADKSLLEQAIQMAKSYTLSLYTETSAELVRVALDSAENISADENAGQAEVDAACAALNTAVNALETAPPESSDRPEVSPAVLNVAVNHTKQFTVFLGNGEYAAVRAVISIDNENVATVSETNITTNAAIVVTGVSQGTAVITVDFQGGPYHGTSRTVTAYVSDESTTNAVMVSAGPGGAVSSPGGHYRQGDQISVSAVPDAHYRFTGWTADGVTLANPAVNPLAFIMPGNDVILTAHFARITHTITASAGLNGSVTPSGEIQVNDGDSQTFAIVPNSGYRISDVLVDGGSAGGVSVYTFSNVTASHAISAVFAQAAEATYTLTVNAGPGGAVSSPGGDYVHGEAIRITATPGSNYRFIGWTATGVTLASSTANPAVFTMPDNSVALTANFTYIGGSSGTGNGGSAPTNSPAEQTIPAANGRVAVGYRESGGEVTLLLPNSKIAEIISKSSDTAKLDASEVSGASSVTLPKTTLQQFKDADLGTEIYFPQGSVKLSAGNGDSIVKQAGGSNVTFVFERLDMSQALNMRQKSAVGDSPVYDISIISGGKQITNFEGSRITVSLNYALKPGEDSSGVVVYYLDADGNLRKVPVVYDMLAQTAVFTTDHLSLYTIAYDAEAVWKNPFTDVKDSDRYFDDIRYAVMNGLFSGTAINKFSPDTAMTRGMLVTILGRLHKADVSGYSKSSFGDVEDHKYYAAYVEWAKTNGIVLGWNGKFNPNAEVTRQDFAVILLNYATFAGKQLPVPQQFVTFADGAEISNYARNAVQTLYNGGILDDGEGDNRIAPRRGVSRAEAAALLHRFME